MALFTTESPLWITYERLKKALVGAQISADAEKQAAGVILHLIHKSNVAAQINEQLIVECEALERSPAEGSDLVQK